MRASHKQTKSPCSPKINADDTSAVPFIETLLRMLSSPAMTPFICWNEQGTSIQLLDKYNPQFAFLLGQFFKSDRIDSFLRKLNQYGFKKVQTLAEENDAYTNRHFSRGVINYKELKLRGSRNQKRVLLKNQMEIESRVAEMQRVIESLSANVENLTMKNSEQAFIIEKLNEENQKLQDQIVENELFDQVLNDHHPSSVLCVDEVERVLSVIESESSSDESK